ncbi:hypothetical protein ABIF83_007262 [Bradyrhizobium ottawaense]
MIAQPTTFRSTRLPFPGGLISFSPSPLTVSFRVSQEAPALHNARKKAQQKLYMRKVLAAKLLGTHLTEANLHYHGSITLDPDHCEEAGISPMELTRISAPTHAPSSLMRSY